MKIQQIKEISANYDLHKYDFNRFFLSFRTHINLIHQFYASNGFQNEIISELRGGVQASP